MRERLIHEELLNMQALLNSRINQERNEIKQLMEMLMERMKEEKKKPRTHSPKERTHSPNEAEITAMIQLVKENQLLEVRPFMPAFLFYFCIFIYILFLS